MKRIDVLPGDSFGSNVHLYQVRGDQWRNLEWHGPDEHWWPLAGRKLGESVPRHRAFAALRAMGYEIEEVEDVPVVPVPEYAVQVKDSSLLLYSGTADACHAWMDRVLNASSTHTVVRLDWAGFIRKMQEAK